MTPEQVSAAFNDHCATLRNLGDLLRGASDIRFSSSPVGGTTRAPGEIPNPTLETVLDPARMEVSDAIDAAGAALIRARKDLERITSKVSTAVEQWHGAGTHPTT